MLIVSFVANFYLENAKKHQIETRQIRIRFGPRKRHAKTWGDPENSVNVRSI